MPLLGCHQEQTAGWPSGPGISGNLEKSGSFVALEKSQEICEVQKSQGILV